MIPQRYDLAGGGSERGHRFAGLTAASAVDADADFGVLLGNVQARATRMNDLHGAAPFCCSSYEGVRRGEGRRVGSLTHGLKAPIHGSRGSPPPPC